MFLQSNPSEHLVNGDIFQFVVEIFTTAVPEPILAFLIFGSVLTSIYMVQRSFVLPAIIIILVGGVTVSRVPLGVQQGVIGALVIALATVGYVLIQRFNT